MTPPQDTNTQAERFVFGNYEIVDTTGAGGMGVVYRAIDMQLGRPVALKILRDDLRAQQHIVARFQREAEAIATLNHPNIVHVYSVGSVGKIPYLAMEFIEGTTLGALLCERGPMPWQEAFAIGAQIAEALASAHEAGVIHRDIKPGNILLSPSGKAYVTDFGIAKVLGATTKLTVDGSRLGTPQYMSPERCKNKEITPASDIYSLGVLLYQSICGRLPYEANSPVELVAKITGEDPVRITEYLPDVPENVDRLLAHMLDPDPRARPQCARALLTLMERVQQGLPLEENPGGAAGALDNFRVQLERETSRRTPQPKTEAPQVPWGVRLSRAWFQMSRASRLGLAAATALGVAALLGLGLYEAARMARAGAEYRLPSTNVDTWAAPAAVAVTAQETPGVTVLQLAMPGMRVTRVNASGHLAVAELHGSVEAGSSGQFGLARIYTEPLSAEIVLSPTPVGEDTTALVGAGGPATQAPAYALAHHGQLTTVGPAPALPRTSAVAQPLADGRWATARIVAGQWQLEMIEADGTAAFALMLTAGPVKALAIAPDGMSAAFVTGNGKEDALWTTALTPGASPNEVARGGITLNGQAFAADGQRFVAVVKTTADAEGEVRVYPVGGGAATPLGNGSQAVFAPTDGHVIWLATDRAGRAQAWTRDTLEGDAQQLSFLGTGLGDSLAVAPGYVLAPVKDQPAIALIAIAQ